jgi:hypothetical protein
VLIKKIPILIAAVAFLGIPGTSLGSNTVLVENTIYDESGRSITVTMSVQKNSDGTYTIVNIVPEQEAKVFFNRACEEEYGPNVRWAGVDQDEVKISSPDSYTYSCHSQG